jgi:hypothetical protein
MSGYIKSIGDSDYNFSFNDFTVEFFVEISNNITTQTLFEITNNESPVTDLYKKTRFLSTIENGNINAYGIQISWPLSLSANVSTFYIPSHSLENTIIFFNGNLLSKNQYSFNNGNITLTGNIISSTTSLVEAGEILFSIKGNEITNNTLHFISAERKDRNFYLYLDGVPQGNTNVFAGFSIPSQFITNSVPPFQQLSRNDSPALLTIGGNKDGKDTLTGKFGDFRVTNGLARHVTSLQPATIIGSKFTDSNLGIRSADIIISGGPFVDNITSYAPEEHVSGQIFDSLDISLYQNANSSYLSSNISNVLATITTIPNPMFNSNAVLLGFKLFKESMSTEPIETFQIETTETSNIKVPWNYVSPDEACVLVDNISINTEQWTIKNSKLNISSISPTSNIKIILTGKTSYTSIGANSVTTLTHNLYSTDSTISVESVAGLITPIPEANLRGKIFINGEKITYLYIDRIHNVLSGLMRGTECTGIPPIQLIGSQVISSSFDQEIPGSPGIATWYKLSNVPLANSNSTISNFLVEQGATPPV